MLICGETVLRIFDLMLGEQLTAWMEHMVPGMARRWRVSRAQRVVRSMCSLRAGRPWRWIR